MSKKIKEEFVDPVKLFLFHFLRGKKFFQIDDIRALKVPWAGAR
jgi:hypothetical protein